MNAGYPDLVVRGDTAQSTIDGVEGTVLGLEVSGYSGCIIG